MLVILSNYSENYLFDNGVQTYQKSNYSLKRRWDIDWQREMYFLLRASSNAIDARLRYSFQAALCLDLIFLIMGNSIHWQCTVAKYIQISTFQVEIYHMSPQIFLLFSFVDDRFRDDRNWKFHLTRLVTRMMRLDIDYVCVTRHGEKRFFAESMSNSR